MENPHAGQGSVLLDIGGSVGALVVTMPAELAGVEVEIGPRGSGDCDGGGGRGGHADETGGHGHHHRPHVAVVGRPVAAGLVHSLVFGELAEGDYELYRRPDGPVELAVSIAGGTVTEATWPARR